MDIKEAVHEAAKAVLKNTREFSQRTYYTCCEIDERACKLLGKKEIPDVELFIKELAKKYCVMNKLPYKEIFITIRLHDMELHSKGQEQYLTAERTQWVQFVIDQTK